MSFFDLDGSGVLSPPPNPLSRNSSLSHSVRSQSVSEEAPPRSWLDRVDTPRPPAPRRSTDSPNHSPNLGPLSQALPALPTLSPIPPSFDASFDAPSSSRKPVLPALQTTLCEAASAASLSPLIAPHRDMSSLPSAVDPPASRGGRFLNFGSRRPPPVEVTSISVPAGPLTPSMDEVMVRGEKQGETPAPVAGEKIGTYEVARVLGKGAFSRVALAKGKGREGELVALKLIARSSYAGNERMRISVVREVEVLKVRSFSYSYAGEGRADPCAPAAYPPPITRRPLRLLLDAGVHRSRPGIRARRGAVRLYRRLALEHHRGTRAEDVWRAVRSSRVDARDRPRSSRHQARKCARSSSLDATPLTPTIAQTSSSLPDPSPPPIPPTSSPAFPPPSSNSPTLASRASSSPPRPSSQRAAARKHTPLPNSSWAKSTTADERTPGRSASSSSR